MMENSTGKTSKMSERYYSSDVMGAPILDAVTGAKYPWNVGEVEENRLFKVIDTANEVGWKSKQYGCRISHKLYYQTPYEYMKHRNIELNEEFIKNWYDKQNEKYPGKFIYVNRTREEE
jgi:hypothetical protein